MSLGARPAPIDRSPIAARTGDGWLLRGERLRGEGPVVVCGHAMMVDRRTLDRPPGHGLASALAARGFDVLVFDARGHGQSVPRAEHGGRWTYDDIVRRDVPAMVRRARSIADGRKVVVLGHSLIGHAAMIAAGLRSGHAPALARAHVCAWSSAAALRLERSACAISPAAGFRWARRADPERVVRRSSRSRRAPSGAQAELPGPAPRATRLSDPEPALGPPGSGRPRGAGPRRSSGALREPGAASSPPLPAEPSIPDAIVGYATNLWAPHLEPSALARAAKAALMRAWMLSTRARGEFDARALGMGTSAEAAAYVAELASMWARDRLGSADGAIDYEAALARVTIPVLAFSSRGDRLLARPAAVERFVALMERAPVEHRVVAGLDHMGFVTDVRARPVWDETCEWIDALR